MALTSNLGRLLKGLTLLPCFVLYALLVTVAKILAVKAGTFNHPA